MLHGANGLRVFDRDRDWSEAFRDASYGDDSYGAAFAPDGRLATTSLDGRIRVYAYDATSKAPNFRPVGQPTPAPGGSPPRGIAFSPDGNRLAVGYQYVVAVDVLDARTLNRVGGHSPANATPSPSGLSKVAWSHDGRTLYAAGGVVDAQNQFLLFAWDRGGLGGERRLTYCAPSTAAGVDALPDGRILVASLAPCLGLMDADGKPVWTIASPLSDFRGQADALKVSPDGSLVDFVFGDPSKAFVGPADTKLRFDLRSLALSRAPNDKTTFTPNREGLMVDGWRDGTRPTPNGRAIPIEPNERGRSLAVASDASRFFLGSSYALTAFDDAGTQKWRRPSRDEGWAVNASRDGQIVVAAEGDGTIRWRRADDGRELLALQVLPNKTDLVLWTPEGFYQATPGAQDVLKWVTNHGPDSAASTLPVSADPKTRSAGRAAAGPPGARDRAGARHRRLGCRPVSRADRDRQLQTPRRSAARPCHRHRPFRREGGRPASRLCGRGRARRGERAAREPEGRAGQAEPLRRRQRAQYLPNDRAGHTGILDALDAMARSMRTSGPDQDVAVILVSSHGEMIDGQFYLIPYGFDAGSPNASATSAVSASEFAKKVKTLAERGKVLLLLDACHSGAVGAGGWATDPDAKVLQNAMDMENVTVLTSSRKNELSQELPIWRHGAFTQAFLDALRGAADPDGHGIIRLSALTDAMDAELQTLTKGQQHLGLHVNFGGDLFVVSR